MAVALVVRPPFHFNRCSSAFRILPNVLSRYGVTFVLKNSPCQRIVAGSTVSGVAPRGRMQYGWERLQVRDPAGNRTIALGHCGAGDGSSASQSRQLPLPIEAGIDAGNDSHQRTEISVLGPASIVESLQTTGLRSVEFAPDPTGMATARYTSLPNSDWTAAFTLRSANAAASELTIQPWLCPRTSEAVLGSETGWTAFERRTVAVDDQGTFWTNGFFGQPFPSVCAHALSANAGGEIDALQDGPCSCTEPARQGTQIEIVDSAGSVISTPASCVARFGMERAAGFSSQIGLALVRDADGPGGGAFALSLNHCLSPGAVIPIDIAAADILASGCRDEAPWLRVGALTSMGKPKPYKVASGTWRVRSAGPTHQLTHQSDIDLTFVGVDGLGTYSVRGHVALPQILF